MSVALLVHRGLSQDDAITLSLKEESGPDIIHTSNKREGNNLSALIWR